MQRACNSGRMRRRGAGFTLLEVVFSMAFIGFALLTLFMLQNVAIGSNRHASRLTTCTMLAQQQMEYLLGLPFTATNIPTDLQVTNAEITDPYGFYSHPNGASTTAINARGNSNVADGPLMYYRTWDVSQPFGSDTTILQIKVRVTFYDKQKNKKHGVTISSFRYQDSLDHSGT